VVFPHLNRNLNPLAPVLQFPSSEGLGVGCPVSAFQFFTSVFDRPPLTHSLIHPFTAPVATGLRNKTCQLAVTGVNPLYEPDLSVDLGPLGFGLTNTVGHSSMHCFVEFIFPRRLHRLAYFLRGVALNIVTGILYASSTTYNPRFWWPSVIVLGIY